MDVIQTKCVKDTIYLRYEEKPNCEKILYDKLTIATVDSFKLMNE